MASQLVQSKRRRRRQGTAGFSVLEALAAAGILGIALVGIVRLHTTSIRGTAQAERIGRASEVARQIAELYATTTAAQLPADCVVAYNDLDGCKKRAGSPVFFTPDKGDCTLYVQGGPSTPSIDDPNSAVGAIVTLPTEVLGGRMPTNQFRLDLAVSNHPLPDTFPDAQLLTVWVCWRSEGGVVNEVTTRRIIY